MYIIYGGLKFPRGKVHESLGMYLDHSKKIIVKASMARYLNSVQKKSPENLVTTAATPYNDHIFMKNDDIEGKYLTEQQIHTLHHTVAQILLMSPLKL